MHFSFVHIIRIMGVLKLLLFLSIANVFFGLLRLYV